MAARESLPDPAPVAAPGTLGEVLYGAGGKALVREAEWVALVRAVASGDAAALHGLYERAHRAVFTLAVRITGSRESAEEVTLDVFHEAWRHAASYDPANGTVLGWIMNRARSRAIDRLRHEHRRKRFEPHAAEADAAHEAAQEPDPCEHVERKERERVLRTALAALSPDERAAIECAFFGGLTHVEAAERLALPLGTVKTRIRTGLGKLRETLGDGGDRP